MVVFGISHGELGLRGTRGQWAARSACPAQVAQQELRRDVVAP